MLQISEHIPYNSLTIPIQFDMSREAKASTMESNQWAAVSCTLGDWIRTAAGLQVVNDASLTKRRHVHPNEGVGRAQCESRLRGPDRRYIGRRLPNGCRRVGSRRNHRGSTGTADTFFGPVTFTSYASPRLSSTCSPQPLVHGSSNDHRPGGGTPCGNDTDTRYG
jgi:hypothetical protein